MQNEKNIQIKKRQLNLNSSNLTEQEYRKKQKEIVKVGDTEIREIKEDLYNKLCASKIKGFETRESLIENLKASLLKKKEIQEMFPNGDFEIDLNEQELSNYKNNLMTLIDKLLNEKQFIESSKIYGDSTKEQGLPRYNATLNREKSNNADAPKAEKSINENSGGANFTAMAVEDPKKIKVANASNFPIGGGSINNNGLGTNFQSNTEAYIQKKKNICLLNESLLQPRNDLSIQYYEKFNWDTLNQTPNDDKVYLRKIDMENLSDMSFQRNKNDEKTQQVLYDRYVNTMKSIDVIIYFFLLFLQQRKKNFLVRRNDVRRRKNAFVIFQI